MPAQKTARVQERRRLINRSVRTRSRTFEKKADKAISAGDPIEAAAAATEAFRALDKAARKGIVHKNNAARHKSRIAKSLNKLSAAQ